MIAILLAVTTSLLVYWLAVALIPARWLENPDVYTRQMLRRLQAENAQMQGVPLDGGEGWMDDPAEHPITRVFLRLPGMRRAIPAFQRAGLWRKMPRFILALVFLFLVILVGASSLGKIALPIAFGGTVLLAYGYVGARIRRHRRDFIDKFPDALDSLVRCLKAGYPLNMAIGVVGEGMEAPVGPEFKRAADEVAYGWTLFDAMDRMADRVDEPDVHYLSVVLSVQQESGGSLTEVLTNLAGVLRKRKQLRLKVLALSSEGRTTAWILGALPIVVTAAVYFFAPQHLEPFFTDTMGNAMLAVVVLMVGCGIFFVRQIVNMEV